MQFKIITIIPVYPLLRIIVPDYKTYQHGNSISKPARYCSRAFPDCFSEKTEVSA